MSRAIAAALLAWGAVAGAAELTLELTPTIHCIGIRIKGVADEIAGANVQFRKQGEEAWKQALPLVVCLGNKFAEEGHEDETAAAWSDAAPVIRRLHGSIFWLEPETAYEVQATLTDAAGAAKGTLSGTATTRSDKVVYGQGRTLKVGADARFKSISDGLKAAKPGDTVLVAPGVYKESVTQWPSGEAGNPITLRGEKGAIVDGDGVPKIADVHGGIIVRDAHDLIIEGLLVKRFAYCMFINTCQRVVVQKNYIDLRESEKSAPYGIRLKRCRDSLVQRNVAVEPKLGEHHYARYPFSIDGGHRNVVRYNQMLGGACHDIITTRNNCDTDIYENVFRGTTNDDGVELEGGTCINLRFFHNLLDCHDGDKGTVSTTPVTVGPVYIVRNIFLCSRQAIKFANDGTSNALKAGHKLCDFAPLFFYHNVFHEPREQFFRFLGCHGRPILVNNIVTGKAMPDVTRNLQADRSTAQYARVEADYNVWWDGGKTTQSPTPGLDAHSLFADPLFVDFTQRDFRLKEGSPAIDKALRLPNVNDRFAGPGPDIGPFESGLDWPPRTLKEPLADDPR
ncbi:MAG TPA: hypothetical protein VNE39_15795 [Planctomycetota bacterium]|nr:hypothetical protein [Planctomycetota bacterium]